jgi:Flp pilus assembly protein TadG
VRYAFARRLPSASRSAEGQSLVELALVLPFLLLLLLGLADFGRAFFYTTVLSNAAREGAAYLSRNPSAAAVAETNASSVKTKVCNETGLFGFNAAATCPLTVNPPGASTFSGYAAGQDAVVVVTYPFEPISSYLINRLVLVAPLPLRAEATYPGLK